MSFAFSEKIIDLLKVAEVKNEAALKTLADRFVEAIETDHLIHTFGTGHSHMIGIELFARAGGLGNVNAILDPDTLTSFGAQRAGAMEKTCGVSDVIYDAYKIQKGDIMIITSNSGRNAMPIEMAMRCQKEGVYVVALTNLEQSKNTTSRHPSGKKLYECADLILDNCVPDGDALLDIHGIKTGGGSSIVSMFLLDIVVTEAIRLCMEKGVRPYVFQSQNVDGFNNDAIYQHFDGRVKHF